MSEEVIVVCRRIVEEREPRVECISVSGGLGNENG